MESNNSGSSVAALTGAMMRPEVEVTHHWVEVTLGLRVCYRWRWGGLRVKKTNHSPPYNNALMYCLSLCVIPWLRKTNAPPP